MERRIQVMGIINVNDDSFYSGSRVCKVDDFLRKAEDMIAQGADILDIGPCSSRPGAAIPDVEEEWRRLSDILECVKGHFVGAVGTDAGSTDAGAKVRISIDTFRSEIVRRSYDVIGDFIVNDISAGGEDAQMLPTVAQLGLDYVAMHLRGGFETMHQNYTYTDVVEEVKDYFLKFEATATAAGVNRYIIDPGFGFSKNIEDNYRLLSDLKRLKTLNRPILVGISRKSMIYKPLGITPEESLNPTSALHLQALMQGAEILRVHDVREAKQCVKLFEMLTA